MRQNTPTKSRRDRLVRKTVRHPEGCWEWLGRREPNGYGKMRSEGTTAWVHRVAYEEFVGPIPSGMVIDHVCHNRSCVNPAHLRAVTQAQNLQNYTPTATPRGVSKTGRRWRARVVIAGKTHHAGYFDTSAEAAEAARLLRMELHTHNTADRS